MTARKLHFAKTSDIANMDDARHGAAATVICDQKPRQGATLWATDVYEDVQCAKCAAKLAEIVADEPAAEPEPVVETPKRSRDTGSNLTDSKEQKQQLRAFKSGETYAHNAARYGDVDKSTNRYTKRRERQGNPATDAEIASFREGYEHAAAELAK